MRSAAGILSILPKNMVVPAVVLAVGWYAGAKYGAPDFLVEMVDDSIKQAADLLAALFGGGESTPPQ